jgi:hypothetical protein
MCGEDRELFFLVRRRFGLDSRDSEAAPLLVESVLSGLCLVMALEVAERVRWPLWGEGVSFFRMCSRFSWCYDENLALRRGSRTVAPFMVLVYWRL